ncbi:MAG: YdeI/OmpD-associated family protein [Chthoniobacterales bacterium]
MTWPESVDEALCVGWIDGLRKSVDAQSYKIRFTPRKAASTWSAVNVARVAELTRERRMRLAGLRAFEQRREAKTGVYAYEQREKAALEPAMEKKFREHEQAWGFFQSQPPSYRKTATWWVISAKRSETKARRLQTLIGECATGQRLAQLRPADRKSKQG